jgi:predicted HTH domain antitoxin
MENFVIEIPEFILRQAKITRENWKKELKKELAIQLYRDGILSYANSAKLAEMDKVDFHFLLGEKKVQRQYDLTDYEEDKENWNLWKNTKSDHI